MKYGKILLQNTVKYIHQFRKLNWSVACQRTMWSRVIMQKIITSAFKSGYFFIFNMTAAVAVSYPSLMSPDIRLHKMSVIIHHGKQVALGSRIISDLVCLQIIIIIKCLLWLESNRSFSWVRLTSLNNLQFVSSDPPPSSFEANYSPRIISPPGVLRLLYHPLV